MNERLVWIDCEMTGLDYVSDALVEIACVVTDFGLNVLGDGVDLVIKPPADAVEQMELLGHNFFVFWDADSKHINMIYRREDGDYGLLEPELA